MISTIVKAIFLLCSFAAMSSAFAQSVIQRSTTPFMEVQPVQNVVAPQAVAGVGVQRWEVLVEDQKLSRALWRWAQQEGIQFFWEAPKDLVAVKASYTGSFAKAVTELMQDTSASSYPLRACRYDNALRILHTSQSCPSK